MIEEIKRPRDLEDAGSVSGEDASQHQQKQPQQAKKPLSFSISRILSEPVNKPTPEPSRDEDYVSRVPRLHGATVHHFAPSLETEHYTHFGKYRMSR